MKGVGQSFARKAILTSIAAIVLGTWTVTVWSTMYRYDHMTMGTNVFPLRTHRFSGNSEMLMPGAGWLKLKQARNGEIGITGEAKKSVWDTLPESVPGDQENDGKAKKSLLYSVPEDESHEK